MDPGAQVVPDHRSPELEDHHSASPVLDGAPRLHGERRGRSLINYLLLFIEAGAETVTREGMV